MTIHFDGNDVTSSNNIPTTSPEVIQCHQKSQKASSVFSLKFFKIYFKARQSYIPYYKWCIMTIYDI